MGVYLDYLTDNFFESTNYIKCTIISTNMYIRLALFEIQNVFFTRVRVDGADLSDGGLCRGVLVHAVRVELLREARWELVGTEHAHRHVSVDDRRPATPVTGCHGQRVDPRVSWQRTHQAQLSCRAQ